MGWGVILLCTAVTGCEDVPQLPRVGGRTPIAGDVVTESGRGGYDWFNSNGVFDITPPSELEILSQIDREVVRANLPNLTFTERTEPYRPEGMEDDVYYIYSRFTEPYFDTKPILTVPFQASSDGMYSVSPNGERLVMLGKQLEVWDLKKLTRLTASALPSTRCTRVIWDFKVDHVLLMDNTCVYRVVAATGEVLKTWKPPQSEEPAFVVRAANSATCAVSTKSKKMYVFGEDLQTTHEFKGALLESPRIAIRPDGNWVLGLSNRTVIRWHISPTRNEIEKVAELEKDEQILFPVAGSILEYCVSPQFIGIQYEAETQKLVVIKCDVNPLAHAGGFGTVDGTQEWFTCCFSRPDSSNGTRQYFLQDLSLVESVFSVEYPLGPEPVLELSMDQSTETCAIRDAKQLRLYRRQRWKDLTGASTFDRLALLTMDGRFEQVELAANELRKQPRLRRTYGETAYANLARSIGMAWADMELDESQGDTEKRKSTLESLELWKSKGSELAVLSSCFRHSLIGGRSRGGGPASSISQSGWDEYEKRNRNCAEEIKPLLKAKLRSIAVLQLAISSGLNMGESAEDLQPFIKQVVELYPYSTVAHSDICLHMLPRWGGMPGEGGAYLASLADLLPQPNADLLYSRVAIRLDGTLG